MSVGTTSHFIDEQGIDGDKVRGERRRQQPSRACSEREGRSKSTSPLVRQAVHDRKTHDDLRLSDGMFHVNWACEPYCFNRCLIERTVP
jgi:hypothetical protein